MITETDVMIVGRVNKTHGTDGELSVSFFDDSLLDLIVAGSCLFFRLDGILVPFFVGTVRPRGGESLLIAFDGVQTQQEAAAFVGKELFISRDEMPEDVSEDDGLYAAQLIGFETRLEDGTMLGVVDDIDESTDNSLFIIKRADGRTLLIPIVDDFITDIDLDNKFLTFDLPVGLIDIND